MIGPTFFLIGFMRHRALLVGVKKKKPANATTPLFLPRVQPARKQRLQRMSSFSTDDGDYREAKSAQAWFRSAIDFCMKGDEDKLRAHVEAYLRGNKHVRAHDLLTDFKSEGKTLVHVAASSGHNGVLQYLISTTDRPGAAANLADDRGFTPLMNATVSESDAAVAFLLKTGANVNARNKDGAAAVHFAAGDGSVKRLTLLCDAGADIAASSQAGNALHWAAGKGRSEAIRFLVGKGIDVNVFSPGGLPAVLMAAVSASDEGVKVLVEGGAEVGHIVSGNLTVLHISAENGLAGAVRAIVATETGRRCCLTPTDDGNLPIHLAAMSGHREIIETLLPHSFPPGEANGHSNGDGNGNGNGNGNAHGDRVLPTVDELLVDGAVRLKAWEEKHARQKKEAEAARMEAEARAAAPATSAAAAAAPPADLEPTTPAASPEDEKESETWKEKGNDLYKKRDYAGAVEAYSAAIRLCGDNAALWSNRSACFLAMGDAHAARAVQDAEVCRRLRPSWSKGCYRLAAARLALKQYEDAALAAFEGCKLDEGNKDLKDLMKKCVTLGQQDHQRKIKEKAGERS